MLRFLLTGVRDIEEDINEKLEIVAEPCAQAGRNLHRSVDVRKRNHDVIMMEWANSWRTTRSQRFTC